MVALLALLLSLFAGTLHVPTDYADIQQAIDAAKPNDTIAVHGGVYDTITIDKPLTIMGVGETRITELGGPTWPHAAPLVWLYGEGPGVVTLSRLTISAEAGSTEVAHCGAAIEGGGFAKLRVLNCTVSGTDVSGPSNGATGGGGILVYALAWWWSPEAPVVIVWRSTVRGGSSVGGHSMHNADGAVGLWAPVAVLIDSTVAGGAMLAVIEPSLYPCGQIQGGRGGVGVHADALFLAGGCHINGGQGGSFFDPHVDSCIKPDGAPIVAGSVAPSSDQYWAAWKR